MATSPEDTEPGPPFTTDRTNLAECGRLQFFYHSPLCQLPVRDVTGEQGVGMKREPHLERKAENYCDTCYQGNNIVPFLRSDERYLFLFTTCRNGHPKHDGRRFIVGYLDRERALDRGDHLAVQGDISLYRFRQAYPLEDLHDSPMQIRMLKTDREETEEIMNHLNRGEDCFEKCLDRTLELEEQVNRSSGGSCGCSSSCGCGSSGETSSETGCGGESVTEDDGGC